MVAAALLLLDRAVRIESLSHRVRDKTMDEVIAMIGDGVRRKILEPGQCVDELRLGVFLRGKEAFGREDGWQVLELEWAGLLATTVVWCMLLEGKWTAVDGVRYGNCIAF